MRTKTVDVNGRSYILRRMDPVAGSFIYMRMMGVIMKQVEASGDRSSADTPIQATPEERTRMMISLAMMSGLSFDDTQFCHKHALRVAAEAEHNIPIMSDDGRWADPEFKEDANAVQALVLESLVFSLTPFFEPSGSKPATGNPATTTP